MPARKKRIADVGVVEALGGKYRVHVQYRDEAATVQNICGPLRNDKQRANEDLTAMRAAGVAAQNASEKEGREEAINAMATVVAELQAAAADQRSTIPWAQRQTPTEAFLRASERALNVQDLVMVPSAALQKEWHRLRGRRRALAN